MEFEVFFIAEEVEGKLVSVWDGQDFSHPSQRAPFYYNRGEIPNAYKLMGGLANQALERGGFISLQKATFIYSGDIAPVPPEPEERPEEPSLPSE